MADQEILERKRRPSLTVSDLQLITAALAVGVPFAEQSKALQERFGKMIAEEFDPDYRDMTDAYRGGVTTRDGDLELDIDAEVSVSEDPGAYVLCWKWVSNAEADICDTCAGSLDDGEGYDGLCGDCADKAEDDEDEE